MRNLTWIWQSIGNCLLLISVSGLVFAGCGTEADTESSEPTVSQAGESTVRQQATGGEGDQCQSWRDCGSGLFCERESCGAEEGVCSPAPDPRTCPPAEEGEKVCGCNGVQYSSECMARAKGVWPDPEKEPPCGDCEESCEQEEGKCSVCGTGTCITNVPSEQECEERETNFICACNKKTYRNKCWAKREGIDVNSEDPKTYIPGPCNCEDKCPEEGMTCAVCPGEETMSCIEAVPEEVDCREEYEKDPVCGCDGEQYYNECAARKNNVRPTDSEECTPNEGCPCPGEDEVCEQCTDEPTCRSISNPAMSCDSSAPDFCGCDDVVYKSECQAKKNGVFKEADDPDECWNCTEDEDCNELFEFDEGYCGSCGAEEGKCVRKPNIQNCPDPEGEEPVCGCDGEDYDSECLARAAGTTPTDSDDCFDEPETPCENCNEDEHCSSCDAEDSEAYCIEKPESCNSQWPTLYVPVCGCNGRTYFSYCEARRSGGGVAHSGWCFISDWRWDFDWDQNWDFDL